MFKYLFLISVLLYFLIPVYDASAKETKVITMNNEQWLVIIEPGKEPMLKPLTPARPKVTKLNFVVHGKEEKETPVVKEVSKTESRIVSECDRPGGCIINEEGDCPSCKKVHVKEETTQVVKSEFETFKQDVKAYVELNNRVEDDIKNKKLPFHLQNLRHKMNDPLWLCYKVHATCTSEFSSAKTISIEDLYNVYKMRFICESQKHDKSFWKFDFLNPIKECQWNIVKDQNGNIISKRRRDIQIVGL